MPCVRGPPDGEDLRQDRPGPRRIKEFRLESPASAQVGAVLTVSEIFKDVKSVDVVGTSKGRGYTGVMKRHNFQGLPAAHGAKKVHRSAGSTS